jgi:hypothetical protein
MTSSTLGRVGEGRGLLRVARRARAALPPLDRQTRSAFAAAPCLRTHRTPLATAEP